MHDASVNTVTAACVLTDAPEAAARTRRLPPCEGNGNADSQECRPHDHHEPKRDGAVASLHVEHRQKVIGAARRKGGDEEEDAYRETSQDRHLTMCHRFPPTIGRSWTVAHRANVA